MPVPLHCRAFGSADAEPLLLVHGLGSTGADWAFQIEALAEHFRVLVPDLPGAGRSPLRGAHSISGYADAVIELLDTWRLTRVHVIGFSMGGAVALQMALQAPSRVARLITINSLPSYRPDTWRKRLELHGQRALVQMLGLRRTAALVGRRLFPHPHQNAMRERVATVLGAYPKSVYLAQTRALAGWCARRQLHTLQAPMLMLCAEHDYTPLAEKQAWACRLGAEWRVVLGSRHGTPFDAIAATNAAVVAFLRGESLPNELRADAPEHVPCSAPGVLAALEAEGPGGLD